MTKSITFALGIVLAFTTWLTADKSYHPPMTLEIVTSFDFAAYPACRSGQNSNCIEGIRFYDADSGRRLAEATVSDMTGRRQITAKTHVSSVPRGIYAVTVYMDPTGGIKEGHPGEVSRFSIGSQ